MAVSGRLLLTCPDQPGLVARVADFVWKLGGNGRSLIGRAVLVLDEGCVAAPGAVGVER